MESVNTTPSNFVTYVVKTICSCLQVEMNDKTVEASVHPYGLASTDRVVIVRQLSTEEVDWTDAFGDSDDEENLRSLGGLWLQVECLAATALSAVNVFVFLKEHGLEAIYLLHPQFLVRDFNLFNIFFSPPVLLVQQSYKLIHFNCLTKFS